MNRIIQALFLLVFSGAALAEQGIVVRSAQLLEQPTYSAKSVRVLPPGTPVDLLKREGGWQQVGTLKVAGKVSDTGWVRVYQVRAALESQSVRMAESTNVRSGVLSGLTSLSGRTSRLFGKRDADASNHNNVVATIGIRGLSEEDLRQAKPNPQALQHLQTFRSNATDAQAFATTAGLQSQTVKLLPASGKSQAR